MFTLRQLEIFVALAGSCRVMEVAERLGMSASAVSMAIRELEKEVGEDLFERIGKRLVLNERGRYFFDRSAPIVEDAQRLFEAFRAERSGGLLHLASSVTISNYLLPRWIGDYRTSHGSVKISVKTANSSDVIDLVRNGKCDLGFIENRFDEPDLSSLTLMHDELIVVGSDEGMEGRAYYIDELLSKRWVLREKGSGTREIFLSQISPIDKELNIDMEFEHNEAIKEYLIHDRNALSCLPRLSVSEELKNRKLFEVRVERYRFEREFKLIWRKEKVITRVIEDFKRYVSELRII